MYSAKHTNKRNANEKPYTLRASECVKNTEIECTWIKAIACACVKPGLPSIRCLAYQLYWFHGSARCCCFSRVRRRVAGDDRERLKQTLAPYLSVVLIELELNFRTKRCLDILSIQCNRYIASAKTLVGEMNLQCITLIERRRTFVINTLTVHTEESKTRNQIIIKSHRNGKTALTPWPAKEIFLPKSME